MANSVHVEVALEVVFGCFCPVCGEKILAQVADEEEPEICKHIMVIYIDVVGSFTYVNPKYKKLAEEIEETDTIRPMELFAERTASPSAMYLAVERSGTTHSGPFGETYHIGIDYAPDSEEETRN